jgi:hypothetical protein
MKYSVYNNHYQILNSLNREHEAEEIFEAAVQLLTEARLCEQLLTMFDIKASWKFGSFCFAFLIQSVSQYA